MPSAPFIRTPSKRAITKPITPERAPNPLISPKPIHTGIERATKLSDRLNSCVIFLT